MSDHPRSSRPGRRRSDGRRALRPGLAAAALFPLLMLGACGGGGSGGGASPADGAATAQHPNILLIVVDTLGAEHLGCQTPGLKNSPVIDRLAAEGVQFTRAQSTAPWTQPAVASLITSRTPSDHGVRQIYDILDDRQKTLAELLKDRGMKTRGVVSHFAISGRLGYAQGFDHYVELQVNGHRAVTSHLVTDKAIAELDEVKDSPFFLFVHYFDPHWYYNHHPEYDETSSYRGRLLPGMEIGGLRAIRDKLAPEDIDYLRGLYREEIAYTDHHIGRLLDHLHELGLDRNTLVILTADHGEEFMRHGWIGHTATLYQELLHIPLIFRMPGTIAPRRVDEPVDIMDVLPTVMDIEDASDPAAGWQGASLRPWLDGGQGPAGRLLFSEVSYVSPQGWPSGDDRVKRYFKTSVLSGERKLIHDLENRRWEAYDLAADPEELHDLRAAGRAGGGAVAGAEAAPADSTDARLESLLRAWEDGRTEQWSVAKEEKAELDPEAIKKLRALGYVH